MIYKYKGLTPIQRWLLGWVHILQGLWFICTFGLVKLSYLPLEVTKRMLRYNNKELYNGKKELDY